MSPHEVFIATVAVVVPVTLALGYHLGTTRPVWEKRRRAKWHNLADKWYWVGRGPHGRKLSATVEQIAAMESNHTRRHGP
jgi:hypothetical protein